MFSELIKKLTQHIVKGEGDEAAHIFNDSGYYQDIFYGKFSKKEIPTMVKNYFHGNAKDFIWDIKNPISNSEIGYARYIFSYTSKMKSSYGKRASFEGIIFCRLKNYRIQEYHEITHSYTGLSMLGFSKERINKIIIKQTELLKKKLEMTKHLNYP